MALSRDGSFIIDLCVKKFAKALLGKLYNELPRGDDEEAADERIMLGRMEGLPRRVEFQWQRFPLDKLGTGVKIRLAGVPCTVNLPPSTELNDALRALEQWASTEVGYTSNGLMKTFLNLTIQQSPGLAREAGITLQSLPLAYQYKALSAIRYWVAAHKLWIWWSEAGEADLRRQLEKLAKLPATAETPVLQSEVLRLIGEHRKIRQSYELLAALKFWKVFFETIYWEHELVPEGGIPGVFLPEGDKEAPLADAGAEPLDANVQPEAQPLGEILENLAGFEEEVPGAEAEEPEMVLEIGEDIDPADPRLHTPRAESYRKLGCKRFVEPLGDFFGQDNGYFAAFLLTAEGAQVLALDTDEKDNAAYLLWARVEGDADATAWTADAQSPKAKVRRARRFIRVFYHVLGWEKNVRRWLEKH